MPVDLALLAHQGGWDEILLVAGPIVVIVGLLAVAKKRVDAAATTAGTGQDEEAPTVHTPPADGSATDGSATDGSANTDQAP